MTLLARLSARSKSLFSLQKSGQGRYGRLNDLTEPLVSECKEVESESTRTKVVQGLVGLMDKATVSKMGRRRLFKELLKIDDTLTHCSYGPVDPEDPFKIQAIIIGPSGTPFEGGIFFLTVHVPKDYPFKPPKIKFHTKVFHPNIRSDGTIEIDILSYNWTPALTIESLLLSICSFLADPDHEQNSCNAVCNLYWKNRKVYDKIARDWTFKYAML